MPDEPDSATTETSGGRGRQRGRRGGRKAAERRVRQAMAAVGASESDVRALSALLGRDALANAASKSFYSDATSTFKRDPAAALGYRDKLTIREYRGRYERGGIAERIVEAHPRATWGGEIFVQEDPDTDVTTPFEEAFGELAERLDLWAKVLRADILAGLGHYSVVLIGSEGALDQPLGRLAGPDAVLYLTPLAEDRALVGDLVKDTADPRWGLPEFYQVKLGDGRGDERKVHHSRILHLAEGTLDNDLYGKPRLRAVWNYLDDLLKVEGGGSEAAWKNADRGMQFDLDPQIEIDATEQAALEEQVDEYQHGLRRALQTRGLRINPLGTGVANFGPNVDSILQLVSATSGIPYRILTGSERGELASTQDRNNWNDRITERRREFARPLVKGLVDRLVEANALPEPEQFEVVWQEAEELDAGARADLVAKLAEADATHRKASGEPLLLSGELRAYLDLDPLDDDQVAEATDDEEPLVDDQEDDEARNEPADALGPDDEEEPTDEALRAAVDADRRSDEPAWAVVHRIADRNVNKLAGIVLAMWAAAGARLDADALENVLAVRSNAMAANMVGRAFEAVAPEYQEELEDALVRVQDDTAEAVLKRSLAEERWLAHSPVPFTFNKESDAARRFARYRSSSLITESSREFIKAMRVLVADGILKGIPPKRLAGLIKQTAGFGLRTDQVAALARFEQQLVESAPGTLVKRARIQARVPAGGFSSGQVSSLSKRYARIQATTRARLIARTETLRSANQGQLNMWSQAQRAGSLPSNTYRKWIVTPDGRLRDEHAAMSNQIRPLNKPFTTGSGRELEPGSDPNCRCTQGIATPAEAAEYERQNGGSVTAPTPAAKRRQPPARTDAPAPAQRLKLRPRSSGQIADDLEDRIGRNATFGDALKETQKELQFHGEIVFDKPRNFVLNGKSFETAGYYMPSGNTITMNTVARKQAGIVGPWGSRAKGSAEWNQVHQMFVHEATHSMFQEVVHLGRNLPTGRGAAAAEARAVKIADKFQRSLGLNKTGSFNEAAAQKLAESDGVTDYSKAYWRQWKSKGGKLGDADFGTAVNETLAEISRLEWGGSQVGTKLAPEWAELHSEVVDYHLRYGKETWKAKLILPRGAMA